MALTAEQQAANDAQVAMEATRHTNQVALQSKNTKLESVRMAKDILIENARAKAVDERAISAADITAFAETLAAYVDA